MMKKDNLYEPIRRQIMEWLWYDDQYPAGCWYDFRHFGCVDSWVVDNQEELEVFWKWNDRACVLTGGDLKAARICHLWWFLNRAIDNIDNTFKDRVGGNVHTNYNYLKELLKEGVLEKLFEEQRAIGSKLDVLSGLCMGRENIYILPDMQLYEKSRDGVAPTLLGRLFPGAECIYEWKNPEAYREWVMGEHLQMFFNGDIAVENIKDLGDIKDIPDAVNTRGTRSSRQFFQELELYLLEREIDNYIGILQERRQYFSEKELAKAAVREELFVKHQRIQEFRKRAENGDKDTQAQIEDIMGDA